MSGKTPVEFVEDGLRYWADSYPRRVTKFQRWATTPQEAAELAVEAETMPENWPFISTYSFPHGHTKDGNVPRVDRLFIDLDVPDDGEYRLGNDEQAAWVRDMSGLLVRTRKVARLLLKTRHPESWQVTLSGHKGVHLDLTFPAVPTANGNKEQFLKGMNAYSGALKEYLIAETGMDDLAEYIDVTSKDLGRLRRVPNTLHLGATRAFGEDRFCVPVTLEELADLRPGGYIEFTRARREVDGRFQPTPNQKAGEVLTQHIRNATTESGNYSTGGRFRDPQRITHYRQAVARNLGIEWVEVDDPEDDDFPGYAAEDPSERITVDDLSFVLSNRPCISALRERDDAFSHGGASHKFELFAITNMMASKVPIETMVDLFRGLPDFSEEESRDAIERYISMGYAPANCETVWQDAPTYCLGTSCQIYRDAQATQ